MSEPEFCVILKREHVLSEEIYTTRAKNFTLPMAVTGMTKELVPFTQLVKVRGGNLVWALPSI